MITVRAIATLGLGYGARSMAYLGLWPTQITPPPTQGHGGRGFLADKPRRRKDTDDDLLLVVLL